MRISTPQTCKGWPRTDSNSSLSKVYPSLLGLLKLQEANPDQNARLAGSTPTDLYLFPLFRWELQLNPIDRSRDVNREYALKARTRKEHRRGPAARTVHPVNAAVARVRAAAPAYSPGSPVSYLCLLLIREHGEDSRRAPPRRLRKSGAGRARTDRCPRHLKAIIRW